MAINTPKIAPVVGLPPLVSNRDIEQTRNLAQKSLPDLLLLSEKKAVVSIQLTGGGGNGGGGG